MNDVYPIIREIVTWSTLLLVIFFIVRFYPWIKILNKNTLRTIKITKTMFGRETVDKRIQGLDVRKVQARNRILIGESIRERFPLPLLDKIPAGDILATLQDERVMSSFWWLVDKAGLKDEFRALLGAEGVKKKDDDDRDHPLMKPFY